MNGDELILELEEYNFKVGSDESIISLYRRESLKNQKLLDEIKGRV
jgi:hypothetical protein